MTAKKSARAVNDGHAAKATTVRNARGKDGSVKSVIAVTGRTMGDHGRRVTGPGFSSRCAACTHPRRPEIDKRLLGGESPRAVSRWLEEMGEKVGKTSLTYHRQEHLHVAERIAELAEEARPVFEAAAVAGLQHLTLLEENAEEMRQLRQQAAELAKAKMAEGRPPAHAVVALVTQASAELRQTVTALQKARGEIPEPDDDLSDSLDRKLDLLAQRLSDVPGGEVGA